LGQIEAELVDAGRRNANFAAVFGAETDSVLAAAEALRARAVDIVAADKMLALPGAPPLVLPAPEACGITLAALSTEAWKSTAFLATGNLPVAIDGSVGDTEYAPLDGDMTFGNVTTHIHQTVHVTLSLTASHAVSVVSMSTTITATGANGALLGSTSENATATIDVDFCPNDAGVAPGMITVSGSGTASPAGGSPGSYQIRGTGSYMIHVNEAAETSSVDLTGEVTYTGSGPTTVDVAGTYSGGYDPASPAATLTGMYTYQRASAPAADLDALDRAFFGVPYLASRAAEDGAKKKWRGGACVAVRVDPGSQEVDPGAQFTVTATPFQKFTMMNLDAPVVAMFTGFQSLSPVNQPVPAPATFSCVAGSMFRQQGVVNMKSTSRRGIGTGTATYTVRCDPMKTCPAGSSLDPMTCECLGGCDPSKSLAELQMTCRYGGTAMGISVAIETDHAQVTWTVAEVMPAAKKIILRPSGTATLPTMLEGCTLSPYTHAIAPSDGHLDLDFSTSPPQYSGFGLSNWLLTGFCPLNPNYASNHGGVWFDLPTPLPFQPGQPLRGANPMSTWDFEPIAPSP
jgi:hypothetical protein